MEGYSGLGVSAAFSPDGTRVVSGSRDMLVKIWDVATGAEVCSHGGVARREIIIGFGMHGGGRCGSVTGGRFCRCERSRGTRGQ